MPTTYDMRDYLANDTPTQGLTGTHFMKTLLQGDDAFVIKGAGGSPFERYTITPTDVFLRQETGCSLNDQCWGMSGGPDDFRFWPVGGYRWCPRTVYDGMGYRTGSCPEYYQWTNAQGTHKKSVPMTDYPCVVNILHDVDLGGTLVPSVRPTIVALSHFWPTGTIDPHGLFDREVYYYDKWLGLVRWEWWEHGVVTMSSTFNTEILTDTVAVGPAIPTSEGFTPCGS